MNTVTGLELFPFDKESGRLRSSRMVNQIAIWTLARKTSAIIEFDSPSSLDCHSLLWLGSGYPQTDFENRCRACLVEAANFSSCIPLLLVAGNLSRSLEFWPVYADRKPCTRPFENQPKVHILNSGHSSINGKCGANLKSYEAVGARAIRACRSPGHSTSLTKALDQRESAPDHAVGNWLGLPASPFFANRRNYL
nr:hypothetical protein Iba_chr02aCG8730 [Ipomoea batatas]